MTLFFAAWLGMFMGLKILILEGYQIRFGSASAVLIGARVLAKIVLILEHLPLGAWVKKHPLFPASGMATGILGPGREKAATGDFERQRDAFYAKRNFMAAISGFRAGIRSLWGERLFGSKKPYPRPVS